MKYVLEGSVRKAADQVRIGVELIDATSGSGAWTARYDRPLKDIFAVQDEIVGRVVTTLGLIFKLDEMNAHHAASFRPTDNLEAYDFLRGSEYCWRLTKDDDAKAREWFEFGEAYAVTGWTYWTDAWNQWSRDPQADVMRSIEMAQKALAVDDSNTDALALLSYADWLQDRYDQAVADAKRAVVVNPNSARAYQALADALLNAAERPEEALRATEKATRLDPAAADFYAYSAGAAYYEMGHYQKAVSLLKRDIAAYPNDLTAHIFLLGSYAELGRDEDARAEAGEIVRISPGWTLASSHKSKSDALNKQFDREFRQAGFK